MNEQITINFRERSAVNYKCLEIFIRIIDINSLNTDLCTTNFTYKIYYWKLLVLYRAFIFSI